MDPSRKWTAALSLIAGLGVGAFGTGLAGSVVSYLLIKKAETDARKGWVQEKVVVTDRPLAPGERVPRE
ncbi:MAG TPA: hypothetical protein VF815_03420, partial [Myxococcaceae bacterium]